VGLCAAHGKVSGGIGLLFAYEGPLIAVMSIAAFVVAKRCRSGTLIRFITPASFGVYLTHVAVLELLERYTRLIVSFPPWYAAPAATLAVFGVSLVLVRCIQAIPVVRRVVG
jgi:surface polysaccharide O-acyltransferase-like enzyme